MSGATASDSAPTSSVVTTTSATAPTSAASSGVATVQSGTLTPASSAAGSAQRAEPNGLVNGALGFLGVIGALLA